MYSFSCILLGDTGTGKTSLLNNFTSIDNRIPGPTIGVDFAVRYITTHNGTSIKIKLWDTAGQERFRSITEQYIRNIGVVFCVYDVTSFETYENMYKTWVPIVKERLHNDTKFVLIGNKNDQHTKKVVESNMAREFAIKNHMYFFEVSAYDKNVYDVLTLPFHDIVDDIERECIPIEAYKQLGIRTDLKRYMKQSNVSCCTIV
jgi:small GTP-binding protein